MVAPLRQLAPVLVGAAQPVMPAMLAIPGAPHRNAMIARVLHRPVAVHVVMIVVERLRRVPDATTGHAATTVVLAHAVMMKPAQRPMLTGRPELFTG